VSFVDELTPSVGRKEEGEDYHEDSSSSPPKTSKMSVDDLCDQFVRSAPGPSGTRDSKEKPVPAPRNSFGANGRSAVSSGVAGNDSWDDSTDDD
jgi:hypothetical protein